MRSRLLLIVLLGFLVGALGGAALLLLVRGAPHPEVKTSGKALIGGPFALTDQTGKTVTDKDFRGRYMLVWSVSAKGPPISALPEVLTSGWGAPRTRRSRAAPPSAPTRNPQEDDEGGSSASHLFAQRSSVPLTRALAVR